MTPDEISHLAEQLESDTLEFKTSTSTPEVLARDIAAFANTRGGTLLIGVTDDGSILGIDDITKTRRNVDTAIKSIAPPVVAEVEQVSIDKRVVLAVHVKKGDSPPHLISDQAYQRVGARLVPMGSPYAPDVHGSAYQAVLGGSGAIAQGIGAVAAGAGGITVGKDIVAENIITGAQVTHVVSYDTAFERVAGSTTFVLTQLELSYRQTRNQSQGWYRLSAVAAAAGFLMIIGGVIAVLAGQVAAGVITSVSGIIPEATAALFFLQGKEANRRVDTIQEKLGDARELLTAVEIANTISDEKVRNQMKASIVLKALGLAPESDTAG